MSKDNNNAEEVLSTEPQEAKKDKKQEHPQQIGVTSISSNLPTPPKVKAGPVSTISVISNLVSTAILNKDVLESCILPEAQDKSQGQSR